jgi:hypothetical protein
MMDTKYQEAERAAERLSELDDETMFETLGIRIEDVKNKGGWQRVQMYDAAFEQNAPDLLSMKDVREIGHRWWRNLEPEIMKLICDTDNADMKKIASGKSIPQVAAGLATAAVVSALAPPAWIIVATTIIATKVAQSGLDAACSVWREDMDRRTRKSG